MEAPEPQPSPAKGEPRLPLLQSGKVVQARELRESGEGGRVGGLCKAGRRRGGEEPGQVREPAQAAGAQEEVAALRSGQVRRGFLHRALDPREEGLELPELRVQEPPDEALRAEKRGAVRQFAFVGQRPAKEHQAGRDPPGIAARRAPVCGSPDLGFRRVEVPAHLCQSRRRLRRDPGGEGPRHAHKDVVQVGADPDRVSRGCRLEALLLGKLPEPRLQPLERPPDGHGQESRGQGIPLVYTLVRR